jgi:hypothetical protein
VTRGAPTAALATALLLASLPAGAAAAATQDEDPRLSAAWPFTAFLLETGLLAGTAETMGWPGDDAMARYGVGLAAGAVPAGAVLALWGTPCAGDVGRSGNPWCWVEAVAQALVVAGIDGAASWFSMRYLMDVPGDAVRPSDRLTAGWSVGWGAGTTVALMLPPMLGAPWGEDLWSEVGLFAWVHGAVAAVLLAVLYRFYAEGPALDWSIQLPVFAGPTLW